MPRLGNRCCALVALGALISTAGCGGGAPFGMAEVGGKVVYQDGSPVKAEKLIITFIPQGVAAAGKDVAPAARGEVNVVDGTFGSLTSVKAGDGVVPGKHKVTILSCKTGQGGIPEPTPEVSEKYRDAKTTPIEVEVPAGGKRDFELKVDKP